MGDPTSRYATASIALRIICKPHHYAKVGIPTEGITTTLMPEFDEVLDISNFDKMLI
jgi:hypothetical protein